jgi:hypothetical protein
MMNDTEGRALLHGIPEGPHRNRLIHDQYQRNLARRAGAWRAYRDFIDHGGQE